MIKRYSQQAQEKNSTTNQSMHQDFDSSSLADQNSSERESSPTSSANLSSQTSTVLPPISRKRKSTETLSRLLSGRRQKKAKTVGQSELEDYLQDNTCKYIAFYFIMSTITNRTKSSVSMISATFYVTGRLLRSDGPRSRLLLVMFLRFLLRVLA